MKEFLLAVTIVTLPNLANCQLAEQYDCPQFDKRFTKPEVHPKFGKDTTDLQNYFVRSFKRISYSFDAKILIFINIDSAGSPCCTQILKSLDGVVDFQKIKEIVDRMPKWTSAKQNGHDVNSSVSVQLSYTQLKLNVLVNQN